MSRDLPHVVSQVFNTPLMIHGEKLDTILAAVGPRILSGEQLEAAATAEPRAAYGGGGVTRFESGGYLADDGIAVLPVLGTLVRRGSFLDAMSGMTSYARLSSAALEMLAHPSVRGVMMEIDSYGGEAGGVFDLVAGLQAASSEYGKPIWAFVNETAASAGYAIACAADEIWLPQMGAVGSIGVVTAHVDMSKADEKAGLKWTYIFNGEHKTDGNPHAPLPADVKARVQADVDDIASKFHSLVADSRGMTAEAVRGTKAGMFRGQNAIGAGLADKFGTFADAMNAFAEHLDGEPAAHAPRRMSAIDQQRKVAMSTAKNAPKAEGQAEDDKTAATTTTTTEPAKPADSAPAAVAPVAPAASADAIAAAVAAANLRATEMTKLASFASKHGITFDLAAAIANPALTLDAARAQVMDATASDSESTLTLNRSTSPGAQNVNHKQGWDSALSSVAARNGIKLAG